MCSKQKGFIIIIITSSHGISHIPNPRSTLTPSHSDVIGARLGTQQRGLSRVPRETCRNAPFGRAYPVD